MVIKTIREETPTDNHEEIFTLPQMHLSFSGDFLNFKILETNRNKHSLSINMLVLKRGGEFSRRQGFYGQFKIDIDNNTSNYSRVCVSSSSFEYSAYYIVEPLNSQECIFDFRNFINTTTTATMMLTRLRSNEAKIVIYSCVGMAFDDGKFIRTSNTMTYHVNMSFIEDVNYFNNATEIKNVIKNNGDGELSLYLGIKKKRR